MVGTPCPKCGANLLTEEDAEQWMKHIQPVTDMMRELGLLSDQPVDPSDATATALSLHLHQNKLTLSTTIGQNTQPEGFPE